VIWIKGALLLLATAVALFLVAANFSSVQTTYKCSGSIISGRTSSLKVAYLRIENYRPWVGLLSKSDGSLMFEIPRRTTEYFDYLQESSINLRIGRSDAPFLGTFSSISKTITLNTGIGQYEGACQLVTADA
jgi:hypothetical protein